MAHSIAMLHSSLNAVLIQWNLEYKTAKINSTRTVMIATVIIRFVAILTHC